MPKGHLAQSFEEKLFACFPHSADLAYERLMRGRTIFFDTHTKKQLYSDSEIFAALYLAQRYAHKVGAKLKLTAGEKVIWHRPFKELEK